MRRRRDRIRAAALCVTMMLLAAGRARAEQDHLLAVKAKDISQAAVPATVEIASPLGSGTCELKKAKFLLMQAEKNGGDDPRGGVATNYVCYKAKCPVPSTEVNAATQFGPVAMASKQVQILCLPADAAICGNGTTDAGEACDGNDDDSCPGLCQSNCTCGVDTDVCGDGDLDGVEECDGADDAACPGLCQSNCHCSVPGCTGASVGLSCWFLSGSGESCTTACANVGRIYDAATETYAGSPGTDAHCAAVVSEFDLQHYITTSCAVGLGCSVLTGAGFRCDSPATTAGASDPDFQRVCACQ